jgi:hypothetical protein
VDGVAVDLEAMPVVRCARCNRKMPIVDAKNGVIEPCPIRCFAGAVIEIATVPR